jgi:uncharacterized protein
MAFARFLSGVQANYGTQSKVNQTQLQVRAIQSVNDIGQTDWDNLLLAAPHPGQPFIRWAFLRALELGGCVDADTGWNSHHLLLERVTPDGTELLAVMPGYLKSHSYGEYVFDWSWADAYHRNRLPYYPKLLNAIPFSPIPGARILGAIKWHDTMAGAWADYAKRLGVSSAHCLLANQDQLNSLRRAGALLRQGIQFHWHNKQPGNYTDFDDYLACLSQSKRKKVRAERRKVAAAGVNIQVLEGEAISSQDWDFFYRCYTNTYEEHRSTPYLSRAFFGHLAQAMPENLVLAMAYTGQQLGAIACSLLLRDETTLYGRYWGAIQEVDCLHFELAYYTPIEFAIARGIQRIEGGAQGEHKLARGFLPVNTGSAHWIADPRFRSAIAAFLDEESAAIQEHGSELEDRSPFVRPLTEL